MNLFQLNFNRQFWQNPDVIVLILSKWNWGGTKIKSEQKKIEKDVTMTKIELSNEHLLLKKNEYGNAFAKETITYTCILLTRVDFVFFKIIYRVYKIFYGFHFIFC